MEPIPILPLRLSDRKLLLNGLDLLAVNGALLLCWSLWPASNLSRQMADRPFVWSGLLTLLWLLFGHACEAYEPRVANRPVKMIYAVTGAGFLVALVFLAATFAVSFLSVSSLTVAGFPFLLVVLLVAGRGLYIAVTVRPCFFRRVLIVGTDKIAEAAAEALIEYGQGVYQVVGFVDGEPAKRGTSLCIADSALPVLGDSSSIRAVLAHYHVSTVVLAAAHAMRYDRWRDLTACLELGVDIIPMPLLYEELTGRVPIEYMGDCWYVAIPGQHAGTGNLWPMVKRAFDLVSALVGLACLGIVFPFIALAIYLDSPGPIFYTQERVGKGGKIFRVYKFRSMRPDAERGKAVWASENDERVTRVGRILRKTHVDEFPQFLNIIKGEMSAVGPRPERPEFVEELAKDIPFYRVRHAVKPGMAGWGLVKQGYGSSKGDAIIKLQCDLYYIKHQSLWLDIVILLKTIVDTLTFRGR